MKVLKQSEQECRRGESNEHRKLDRKQGGGEPKSWRGDGQGRMGQWDNSHAERTDKMLFNDSVCVCVCNSETSALFVAITPRQYMNDGLRYDLRTHTSITGQHIHLNVRVYLQHTHTHTQTHAILKWMFCVASLEHQCCIVKRNVHFSNNKSWRSMLGKRLLLYLINKLSAHEELSSFTLRFSEWKNSPFLF